MPKQISGATAGGTGIDWNEFVGKLVVVEPLGQEFDIKTVHGTADAVRANVYILLGPGKVEEFEDTLIFQRVMQGQLKRKIGEVVVGRVIADKTRQKPGQSAPWVLAEPKEGDLDKAGQFWAAKSMSAPAKAEERPARSERQAPREEPATEDGWDDSGSADEAY
jgi:hypothetical protein